MEDSVDAVGDEAMIVEAEIAEVGVLVQRYDALGTRYNAILADETQSAVNRGRAADILGQMKYVPAIPTLIKHLTLADPTRFRTGDDLESVVCFHALCQFGELAIPAAFDAYLAEIDPIRRVSRKEDDRRELLLVVLGNVEQKANIHFQGLVATHEVRITKAKQDEWNSRLGK